MVGYAISRAPKQPTWLDHLLSEKFFASCQEHSPHFKKAEKNIFCIDCGLGICQHCVCLHASHRLLQIRRYVYNDVIRLHDIQKWFHCARVQTYIINSAKVVFLNERPQTKPSKGAGNVCRSCDRSLQEAYRYCSVACKVKALFCAGYGLRPRSYVSMDGRTPIFSRDSAECSEVEESCHEIGDNFGHRLHHDRQFSRNVVHHRSLSMLVHSTPQLSSPNTSSGSVTQEHCVSDNGCTPSHNLCRFDDPTNHALIPFPDNVDQLARLDVSSQRIIVLPDGNSSMKRRKGKPHRSPIF